MKSPRGMFIVLEGADRVGKSTQARLLVESLNKITNKDTLFLKFPDRQTAIGANINDYLVGKQDTSAHALHLLFTANRWEHQSALRSAISNGICAVADRYTYSGIAYTAAKFPPTPNWDWCVQMEAGLMEPDLVVCLTPEKIDDLSTRNGFGDERYENNDFQIRVLENYVRLAKELEAEDSDKWHFVQSTNRSIEEVHECIMTLVNSKLEEIVRSHGE